MIQIYGPDNTDFKKNGDMVLMPSSCTINAELNGAWTIELEHPLDGEGRWKWIEETAVIKVPSFLTEDQLFRLKSVEKSDAGISASGEPIFMDAMDDCFLTDIRPTNKTGQEALDLMTAPNSKYTGISNISRAATAYYEYKNLIEAINSDDENSFINRWGGEILFNNFDIIINERVGADNGVQLLYGKNISENGFRETIDTSSVVTRIYPQAYNGRKPSGALGRNIYVDSPIINSYPTIHSATITFDNVKFYLDASEDEMKGIADNGVYVCYNQAQLDARLEFECEREFEKGQIDRPSLNIEADMVLLKNTEQYKDYAVLEDVGLGDTIHCKHNRLGIVTDARVISLEYDCVLKKANSVKLGDFTYNYFNNVSSAVNRIESAIRQDGSIVAEQVQGFINGAWAQLKLQNTVAKKQDVRAILFEDLDPKSSTFGALAIGTQGLQISKKRNEDDTDWVWTTALTSSGLIADIVIAGILSDKLGENSWNLDTGDFTIKKGSINITVDNDSSIIQLTGKSVKNEYIKCTISPGQCTFENITQGTSAIMQSHMMAFQKNGQNVVYADKNGLYVNSVNNVAIMGTWNGVFPIPGYNVHVVSGIIQDITEA